jgi:hypothetical protein
MKITCPNCWSDITGDSINVEKDIAVCHGCNEVFKVSDNLNDRPPENFNINNSPKGVSFRHVGNGFLIEASTRSPVAFFLVPFMLVWSGGSLGGIYGSQIANGSFDLLESLFGIPFLFGSIIFWIATLMAIWGKVTVTVKNDSGMVFAGVGSIGWRRKFNWSEITAIREATIETKNSNSRVAGILLEGKSRLRFASNLDQKKRSYFMQALRYLKFN